MKIKIFDNLTDFGLKRNAKQAIGFYLAYLFMMFIVAFIIGTLFGLFVSNGDQAYDIGVKVGTTVSVAATFGIGFLILRAKKLLGSFGYILFVLISTAIALYIGGLVSFVALAWLTTREINTKK